MWILIEFSFELMHYPRSWFRLDPKEDVMGTRFIKLMCDHTEMEEEWKASLQEIMKVITEANNQLKDLKVSCM